MEKNSDKRLLPLTTTMKLVADEVSSSRSMYPSTYSTHHGLSVIQEEVFELMLEVYKKNKDRDKDQMRREAVQIAATAIRFIEELT